MNYLSNNKIINNFDLERINDYKKYVLSTGGRKDLLELPAINNLIENIVVNGDPVVKFENKSPIYYKEANNDGTFDICGRMNGYNVSVIYKMEYCNDKNLEHFLLIRCFEDNFESGVNYYKFFVNKFGMIVDKSKIYKLNDFNLTSSGLLSTLKEKKILKKII